MKKKRDRLYEIIELAAEEDKVSAMYDFFMMLTILLSLVPLVFKETYLFFEVIDKVTVSIFIADYILRLITADHKLNRGIYSFLLYPFTFMAIVDMLSILPSFSILSAGMRSLKIFRLFRTFKAFRAMKVFKAFKAVRYSKSISIILNVIKEQKAPLLAVGTLAVGYVLISALVVFNVEPDTFDNFFDAIYWATVSLTTMGYGDIYPVTTAGRLITMLSSFIGIAIIALPSGIITAGYMDVINRQNEKRDPEGGNE